MDLKGRLQELEEEHLLRTLKYFEPVDAVRLRYNGRIVLDFSSNDYLGLSKDARVIEAAGAVLRSSGVGAGASRLISGSWKIHRELEERLAGFKRKESAVVFPTGYMANVGIVSALFGKRDCLFIDKLSHASVIDACTMSGADTRVFPHKNYERLDEMLTKATSYEQRCIITDSVFSMDGDVADLGRLVRIKNKHGALLMIDEAHATGVFGTYGRGLAEEQGVEDDIDICMGTLSKALGGLGGFISGTKTLIDYVHNKARSFIYTTSLPAPIVAALIRAIDIVEEDIGLRQRLWNNVAIVRAFVKDELGSDDKIFSPIIPVIVGDAERALALSGRMLGHGFYMPAVRYPTVGKNKARLRISLSAAHSADDIIRMLTVLKKEIG
jgi:glycine C-acetyltransferase/8-amino-7-oxononanoate synthase